MSTTAITAFRRQTSVYCLCGAADGQEFAGTEPFSISYQKLDEIPMSSGVSGSKRRELKSTASSDDLIRIMANTLDRPGKNRNLLGNAPVFMRSPNRAVLTFSVATTEILTANDVATRLFGVAAKDGLVGKKLESFLSNDARQRLGIRSLRVAAAGSPLVNDGKILEFLTADHSHSFAGAVWTQSLCQPSYASIEHQYINALNNRRLSVCATAPDIHSSESLLDAHADLLARQLMRRASVNPQHLTGASDSGKFLAIIEPVDRITATASIDESLAIVKACPEFVELFQASSLDELQGTNVSKLIPAFDVLGVYDQEFKRAHACAMRKDGTTVPVTVNVKSKVISGEDNTQNVSYHLKLWIYRHISGLLTASIEDGTIRCCNEQFGSIVFGYKPTELRGKNIRGIIPGFALNPNQSSVPGAFAADTVSQHQNNGLCHGTNVTHVTSVTEAAAQHKDGHSFKISYSVYRITSKFTTPCLCIWIFREAKLDPIQQDKDMEMDKIEVNLELDRLTSGSYSSAYVTLDQVGKGAFGCVRLAIDKAAKRVVVTKFIPKGKVLSTAWFKDKNGKLLPTEIHLLKQLQHPNIIKIIDVHENEFCFQAIMEKHGKTCMDLYEFVEHHPRMDEPLSSYIFRQVVSAISYLQSLGIIHGDIKDENVIINERFHCKLIDFGSAAYMRSDSLFSTFCGTIDYCSPEVLLGNKYRGPELEIWSLGCVLYILVFGINPFQTPQDAIEGFLEFPWTVSELLNNLITTILCPIPEHRATIEFLNTHAWLTQSVNIDLYRFEEVLRLK